MVAQSTHFRDLQEPTEEEVIEAQQRFFDPPVGRGSYSNSGVPLENYLAVDRKNVRASVAATDKLVKVLQVGGVSADSDLSWLPPIPSLIALKLTKVSSALSSLAGIERYKRLQALSLVPASSLSLDSLVPLRPLEDLRLLVIGSIDVKDKSLAVLKELKKLELLVCAASCPRSEFESLAAALPNLKCSWFSVPAWELLRKLRREH
jgi:hypothetical protein